MDIIQLIGICGAGIILIFFGLNQFGRLTSGSLVYDLGNAIGGTLLVVFAYLTDSMPFLVLNSVWAIVSWKDVVLYFTSGKK